MTAGLPQETFLSSRCASCRPFPKHAIASENRQVIGLAAVCLRLEIVDLVVCEILSKQR